jgi:YVTN family beta-propeller protein
MAPATVPSTAEISVRAVSQIDPNRAGTASLQIFAAADPTLTEISPTSTSEGSFHQDVYLTGTDLLSTSLVRVNGNPLDSSAVTFIAPALLRARIPASFLNAPGTLSLDVQRQSGATTAAFDLTVEPVRPAILGVAPGSGRQGGTTFDVGMTGGYFSPSVVAEFNGNQRAPSLVSSRELSVPIQDADLSQAGLFALTVRHTGTPQPAQPINAINVAVRSSAVPGVVATLPVGMQPSGVAVNTATGVAVVTNRGSNNVSLIALASNTVMGMANTVIATVPVGMAPVGVAVDNLRNLALVANHDSNDVSVVDLAGQTVTSTITGVGNAPFAVGVNPLTGRAIVVNRSTNTASILDLTMSPPAVAGTVSISTGDNPAVAVDPRLNWAFVTPGGAGTFSIVDLGRRSVVATITLGLSVRGVSLNTESHELLIADPTQNSLLLLSALNQTVRVLSAEVNHVATAVNALTNTGISVNSSTNLATVVHLGDLATPASPVGTVPVGTEPRAVAIDPGNNVAVVANVGSNDVSIVSMGDVRPLHVVQTSPLLTFSSGDPLTLDVIGQGFEVGATVRLDEAPVTTTRLSARHLQATVPPDMLDRARRYVVDVENPGPVRSNVSDLLVVKAVTVGTAPRGVAIDPTSNLVVVANSGSNDVSLVDLATETVTETIAVGTSPHGVAVMPRFGRAVVTNRGSSTASLIDFATAAVTATADVGAEPTGVAISPDTGDAIIANSSSNTISIFSAIAGPPTDTFATDLRPVAAAVDTRRNEVAIVHATQNTISVFSLLSNTVRLRGIGFQLPTGIVYDPVSDRYLVVSSLTNNVVVVNPADLSTTALRVGINPTSIAFNFNTGTLVTANFSSGTLSVVDYLAGRVRDILALPNSQQFALDVHPGTNLAVVADETNNRILLVPLPR